MRLEGCRGNGRGKPLPYGGTMRLEGCRGNGRGKPLPYGDAHAA